MRKIFLLSAVILALAAVKVSAAALTDKPFVAVLPYANKAAVDKNFKDNAQAMGEMSRVSEYIMEKLIDSGKFRVEEREYRAALAEEHEFNRSGFVDESTAVRVGKLVGVKYLVAGSITNLSTKDSGISGAGVVTGGLHKKAVVAAVTIRFIDVETGEVVLMAHGTGESARTNADFTFQLSKSRVEETTTEIDGVEVPVENVIKNLQTQTIKIGGEDYALIQVENAILHAVDKAFDDKTRGVLAKLKKG